MRKIGIVIMVVLSWLLTHLVNSIIYFSWHLWRNLWLVLKSGHLGFLTNVPEFIRQAWPAFDANGLLHHITHLEAVKNKIPFWDLNKQAEYVDVITYADVKKGHFIDISIKEFEKININSISTTSIGNIAFIALYYNNADTRANALLLLREIRQHYEALIGEKQ